MLDIVKSDQAIVKQVIQRYAQFKLLHGDIRLDTIFDDTQGRYALIQVGWENSNDHSRRKRVRGDLIYIMLHDRKVWIEYDGMECGITDDLIAAGVPAERIVLAFLSEPQLAAAL